MVLPLDHGFTSADVAVLTEQDMLGDRLVRRRKKRRKGADAFLAELATLSPGDLVVHADHGIGRYEGLTSIQVGKAPHDCVALEYAGGNKLYVPVENIDVLIALRQPTASGVTLDRLGGEAWQRRKSRMKERIREIAGELIKTAALRATRPGAGRRAGHRLSPSSSIASPMRRRTTRTGRSRRCSRICRAGRPMDRLVCGDVGFGKTEVALRAAFVAAMAGMPGGAGLPDHPPRPPALSATSSSASRASRSRSGACRGWCRPPRRRRPRKASRRAGRHRHRHPRAAGESDQVQETGPGHRRRGAAFRSRPQGAAEGASRPTSMS